MLVTEEYEKDLKIRLNINPFGKSGQRQIRTIEQTLRLEGSSRGQYGKHDNLVIRSNILTSFIYGDGKPRLFIRGRQKRRDFCGLANSRANRTSITDIINAINKVNTERIMFMNR